MEPGEIDRVRRARIEPIHTPGHTAGMLSLLVDGTDVFTGDTLFKGSVGGVRAPGHTTYADLKSSIMDKLLKLPPETRIHPATPIRPPWPRSSSTTGFVRIWRGLDPEGDEPCTALGEPATLILLGDDYDGGHKAWVRWPDGSDDIVPGSQVQAGASELRAGPSRMAEGQDPHLPRGAHRQDRGPGRRSGDPPGGHPRGQRGPDQGGP